MDRNIKLGENTMQDILP